MPPLGAHERLRNFLILLALALAVVTSDVPASTFAELEHAFNAGASSITVMVSEMMFSRQLSVNGRMMLSIEGAGATLSGGDSVRLFSVTNESHLSLRSIHLVHGRCLGQQQSGGGAIFVSTGSALLLIDVSISASSTHLQEERGNNHGNGGAIYAIAASVIAISCTLTSNSAHFGGAVFAGGGSTVTATNCTLTANHAVKGGVVAASGDATINATDCLTTANTAVLNGGVIYVDHGAPAVILTDSTLIANRAGDDGGLVYSSSGSTISSTRCAMSSNYADNGGVVYASDGSVFIIAECLLAANSAEFGAVGFLLHDAKFFATACLMTSNKAVRYAHGGIIVASDDTIVNTTDCTMTFNAAQSGGVFEVYDQCTVIAVGCIMSQNSVAWSLVGGGVIYSTGHSTVTVTHSTLTSNYAGDGRATVG